MDSEPALKRSCFAFAQKECANNLDGWCLSKDCPCFAFAPMGWVCDYFLKNVLPLNPPLLAVVRERIDGKPEKRKNCVACGASFIPASNRQRYCQNCAKEAKRRETAKRAREYRARNRA